METFSALLALCAGNSPVTGGHRSPAGDLRRHRAHYDVIVMKFFESDCYLKTEKHKNLYELLRD